MLNVTEQAGQAIKDYLAEQNIEGDVLRIFFASGCGGGSLRIALDQPSELDNIYELDGLKYAIEKDLDQELGDVFVSIIQEGDQDYFNITTTNPVPFEMGCGGCTSCG